MFSASKPLIGNNCGVSIATGMGMLSPHDKTLQARLSRSLHSQRLEHRVNWVGVKACLKLGEQLARYRRNVLHARHRQKQALGTGVEGNLQGFSQILNRDYASA